MRSLSATLLAEQRDSNVAPFVQVYLKSPFETYKLTGNISGTFEDNESVLGPSGSAYYVTEIAAGYIRVQGVTGSFSDTEVVTGQSSAATITLTENATNEGYTEYTYKSSDATKRVKEVSCMESVFGSAQQTTITLNNYDRNFSAKDLRGYKVVISWGCITAASEESSAAAPLWVLDQRDRSQEGILVTELVCIDVWWRLAQLKVIGGGTKVSGTITGTFTVGESVTNDAGGGGNGAADYVLTVGDDYLILTGVTGIFKSGDTLTGGSSSATILLTSDGTSGGVGRAPGWDNDTTILNIIKSLTAEIAEVLDDTGGSDAALATTPTYTCDNNSPVLGVLRRMLEMTSSAMRFEDDGKLHLIYLDPSPSTDYSYDDDHAFHIDIRDQKLVVPNKIFVIDKLGPDYSFWGVANDYVSQEAIGTITRVYEQSDISSNAEAEDRAETMLLRMQHEVTQGRVLAPMNCGQEVLDYISIGDTRADITVTGRVAILIRTFEAGVYSIECRMGSIIDFLDTASPQSFMDMLFSFGYGRLHVPGGAITGPISSPSAEMDADKVTYTPSVLTDWDGDADPGNADNALDQLAERVDDNEIAIAANVPRSLFDAHTILKADTDDTPVALTVTDQCLVGRLTGGNIAAIAIGIADNNILQVDHASPAANDYAKFTAAGIEGRSYAETLADISPLTTRGDMMFRNATVSTRLAKGADNTILAMGANDPEWKTPATILADLSGQAGADFSMNTHKITAVVDPTADQDAATKKYVDDTAGGTTLYAFKTITGITNDVVADQIADTLTLASADAKLTIVGTAATDTITFTVVEGQIDHNALTNTHNLTTDIDHDALTNFVLDEHVAHSGVNIIAGTGMSGGGDISASRTLNCTITQYTDADAVAAVVAENPLTLTNSLVVSGTYISVGANPATGGYIRLPNAQYIEARNAANTANLVVIGINASDNILISTQLDMNAQNIINCASLATDTINERTGAAGVTIEQVLLKDGQVDGRDVSVDGTKLDSIETSADVTDATNVNAAGAVMESDFNADTFLYATNDDTPVATSPANVMAALSGHAAAAFDFNNQNITLNRLYPGNQSTRYISDDGTFTVISHDLKVSGGDILGQSHLALRTGTNQAMYFDCGANFTFRDRDAGYATRLTLNSANGNLSVTGTITGFGAMTAGGQARLNATNSIVHLHTGANQSMYFDCGGTFTWRDRDGGYAVRMSLNSSTGALSVSGCVTDGTCEIMTSRDAIGIIKDILTIGSGEYDEHSHERMDLMAIHGKYPFLIHKEDNEYFDRLGAKSDLCYVAIAQLDSRLRRLEEVGYG